MYRAEKNHGWRYIPGREGALYSMTADKVTACAFPTSGHVLLFSGSSEIRRKNEKTKKELAKKLSQEVGEALPGEAANDGLFEDKANKLRVDQKKPVGVNDPGKRKERKLYSISRANAAKIRDYCQTFFRAGARSFATLTFIAPVSDRGAMRCFTNYMNQIRKYWQNGKPNYIAVMERQANGNAHFHLLLDRYVNINRENSRWVRVQYNYGLMGKSKKGVEYSRDDVEFMIASKTLRGALNPFDIKKMNDSQGVAFYVTKYVTKSVKERVTFDVKPWTCSRSISKLFKRALIPPELFEAAQTDVNTMVRKSPWVDKETGEVKAESGEVIRPYISDDQKIIWAKVVGIVNKKIFHEFFQDMDEINRRILKTWKVPDIEKYDFAKYYHVFCRKLSSFEKSDEMSGYKNRYLPKNPGSLWPRYDKETEGQFCIKIVRRKKRVLRESTKMYMGRTWLSWQDE